MKQPSAVDWGVLARELLDWHRPFSKTFAFDSQTKQYQWFAGGQLNITHNCLDRHLAAGRGAQPALIYVDENNQQQVMSYDQLLRRVNQTACTLQTLGVTKGDVVTIYMTLSIEQVVTMLACARIGAIHSVVFAGFSTQALRDRLVAANSTVLVTSDSATRRGQQIDLVSTARQAALEARVSALIRVRGEQSPALEQSEYDFHNLVDAQSDQLTPVWMDAEDPLFILYTSGTTGAPKGIVHTVGGYSLYTHLTARETFNLQPGTKHWCTADCGWITGHSYIVYGPLSNGATSIIAAGVPDYPDPHRWWQLIDELEVEVFYTAPTAIRLLMKHGAEYPMAHQLTSLKVVGSVGEPLNPEAWHWLNDHVAKDSVPIVDTWWQTETGGHILVTLPADPQKPGKAGLPFPGITAAVVDADGKEVPTGEKGYLVITKPWPSALRDCWQDHERYLTYWETIPPYYFSGDIAVRDDDGYIQVLGRADDVISVSGHRIGSAELENVLVQHPAIVEAAAIGVPDEVTGERIVVFVVLADDVEADAVTPAIMQAYVKEQYAAHAKPSEVVVREFLPKTRSGKIMRRVLRAELTGAELGDTSTLES